nr:IS66 family insertion sequence element accessory protein TnpB [Nitrosomonas sp. Nm58]
MPGLIIHPGQIWLVAEPVDMRRGIDGLSMIVQQALAHSPCAGSAFVFSNRAGNRIKVLRWDGTGYGYVIAACMRDGLSGQSRVSAVLY